VSDPFSQPPLIGSKSDDVWVKQNAALFGPEQAWSIVKLLAVVVLVTVFVLPLVAVLFGMWGAAVFVWLLAATLAVHVARKRRRRRARVDVR
jgi:Flp pilus assembly protein TadB